jgi:hypothetical protein
VFDPGRPFQLSRMFVNKARAYPIESTFKVLHSRVGSRFYAQTLDEPGNLPLSGAPESASLGKAPAKGTNIGLGWKGIQGPIL